MPKVSAERMVSDLESVTTRLAKLSEEWGEQMPREVPFGLCSSMEMARIKSRIAEDTASNMRMALLQLSESIESAIRGATAAAHIVTYADRRVREAEGHPLDIIY